MKKVLLVLSVVLGLGLFASCATIIAPEGEKQIPVTVNVEGYEVTVNGLPVGEASLVTVHKGDIVVVTKDGYSTSSTMIQGKFNGWVLGNLILGGVIGIIVDAVTGNITKVTTPAVHAKLKVQ